MGESDEEGPVSAAYSPEVGKPRDGEDGGNDRNNDERKRDKESDSESSPGRRGNRSRSRSPSRSRSRSRSPSRSRAGRSNSRSRSRSRSPKRRSRSRSAGRDRDTEKSAPEPNEGNSRPQKTFERREGDWVCPKCSTDCFGSKSQCFKCGTAKPGSDPKAGQPGDWGCSQCGFSNFAKRWNCFKCSAPKPNGGPGYRPGPPQMGGSYGGYGQQYGAGGQQYGAGGQSSSYHQDRNRPGDWTCPECQANVFGWRNECVRCRTPKPASSGGPGSHQQQHQMDPATLAAMQYNAMYMAYGQQAGYGMQMPPQGMPQQQTQQGRGGNNAPMRPGDWSCPSCASHNFASRSDCFRCKIPKPAGMGNPAGMGSGRAPPQARPGDWTCSQCNANVFASRNECFKCRAPRS